MPDLDHVINRPPAEVLREGGRDSYGVVRILAASAGKPGDEREYKSGDEVLVEHGMAEWVIAPVHLPSAGRRLDGDAEREQTPQSGVEVFPPAEPTTAARRAEARQVGHVAAHADEGLAGKLASARLDAVRDLAGRGDAARQAELGGMGARSGPITSLSDLPADKALAAASSAADETTEEPKQARTGGSAPGRKS